MDESDQVELTKVVMATLIGPKVGKRLAEFLTTLKSEGS